MTPTPTPPPAPTPLERPRSLGQQVSALETYADRMAKLCGEVLATLELPRNRSALERGEGVADLYREVTRWRAAFNRLEASDARE